MRQKLTLIAMIICAVTSTAQIITFDDQSHTPGQILTNPYSITNNGETFLFTISGGVTTNHIYRTSEPSCGSSGIGHIYAGNTSQTSWSIETASGNEIDLGAIRFDNVFQCFAFEYNLTIEGFKDNVSTGSQSFITNGLNSIFTSNSSFNDVDKIVITSTNLGNLGIDDINWTAATLHNEAFVFDEDKVKLEMKPGSNSIRILFSNHVELKSYTIYSISGVEVSKGNTTEISTASWAKGVYIIKLDFDKGTITKKGIVK